MDSFPAQLINGTTLLKVSRKGKGDKICVFRIDPDDTTIRWQSKKHGIIPIENIKELRAQSDARYDRQLLGIPSDVEDRWISIVYLVNGDYQILHLVAPDKELFDLWHNALRKMLEIRQGLMDNEETVKKSSAWEKKFWKAADTDGDKKIAFRELKHLCHRLNINAPEGELEAIFNQCDAQKSGYLDFEEYQQFVKILKKRPDIDRLHSQLSSKSGQLDLAAFELFLKQSQRSTKNSDEISTLFNKYTEGAPHMTSEQLNAYLHSNDSAAFSDHKGEIRHDMTRPMSEYFISSSHNTYLIGHQLVGASTVEGYIRALLHSCRSVEMDIYDGDEDYKLEPIVYHGKTFTSKVPVRDICAAIKKYGFTSSPYPVIISAEVHCGLAQQDKLVAIMRQVFGEDLVEAPVDGRPRLVELPSPEALKGKFLLKAKNMIVVAKAAADQANAQKVAQQADSSDSDSESSDEQGGAGGKIGGMMSSFKNKLKKAKAHVRPGKKTHGEKPLMSFQLAALLVYTVGVKCRGLSTTAGSYAPEHIFSLSESAANAMLKDHAKLRALIEHNRTHVSRIYPKGTRIGSTNYEPHRYWAVGCQLVALNWQTFDMGYMINIAMFKRNGHAGYILKPLALRQPNSALLDMYSQHVLDITVISAQQLPRPRDKSGHEIIDRTIVDPFVRVTLYIPDWSRSSSGSNAPSSSPPPATAGDKVDSATSATPNTTTQPSTARTISARTKVIRNNGFNPIWDEQLSVPFDIIGGIDEGGMKELIFVKIAVWDDEDDEGDEPLGVYCTSLGSLEMGYRHLPLHDSQMTPYLFSTLFVNVGIRDA